MPGHEFPAINVHDNATVHLGDRVTYITNNGPLLVLDSQELDIDSLQQQLVLTSSDFGELRRLIEDGSVDISSGPDLLAEVTNVESMVETLKFHLEENDFRAGEGWQRPLQDVNRVVNEYRDRLRNEKAKIEGYRAEAQVEFGGTSAPFTELRELKLKLGVAISMLSYCTFQAAGVENQAELRDLDVRLRQLWDELENEKATRIQPGQAWNTVVLSHVDTDYDFVLHRHLQGSIEDDQTTIRAASMQVSTLLHSPSIRSNISTNTTESMVPTIFDVAQAAQELETLGESPPSKIEQKVGSASPSRKRYLSTVTEEHETESASLGLSEARVSVPRPSNDQYLELDANHRWVTFSCITGRFPHFTEVLICRLLVNVNQSVQQIKKQLRESYPSILNYGYAMGNISSLFFFYGCVYLSDYLRFSQICHANLAPRIVCILPDTKVDMEGNGPLSLTLQTLRKLVRTADEYAHHSTLSTEVGIIQLTFMGNVDLPVSHERLVAELLAYMVVGMQYDDENGKHAAIHAYSEVYRKIEVLLKVMTGDLAIARTILQGTARELARRIGILEDAQCFLPHLVYTTTTCNRYASGTAVNVLAVSTMYSQVKVMPADGSEDFLSHAWNTGNGWLKISEVTIRSAATIPVLSLPFDTAIDTLDDMGTMSQSPYMPSPSHYRSFSTKSDSAIPTLLRSNSGDDTASKAQASEKYGVEHSSQFSPNPFAVATNCDYTSINLHKGQPFFSFSTGESFYVIQEEGELWLAESCSGAAAHKSGWIHKHMASPIYLNGGANFEQLRNGIDALHGKPEAITSAKLRQPDHNVQNSQMTVPMDTGRQRSKSTSGMESRLSRLEVKRKPLPLSFRAHAVRAGNPDEFVHGLGVNSLTNCEHWDSELDIIAIKHKCCKKYCACIACHDILAGHKSQVWTKAERDTFAVLCGRCRHEMTISKYLISNNQCPNCQAGFNPGCAKHYGMYFEM